MGDTQVDSGEPIIAGCKRAASEQRSHRLHLDVAAIDRRGQDVHQLHALIIRQLKKSVSGEARVIDLA